MKKYLMLLSIFVFTFSSISYAKSYDIKDVSQAKCVSDYDAGTTVNSFDTVTFGRYHQSSASSNEPIEWIVLEKNGDSALLLSKYALDFQKFNEDKEANKAARNGEDPVTWEESSLRNWLNGTFFYNAFDTSERPAIMSTNLSNNDTVRIKSGYSSSGEMKCYGNDTIDQVFILSLSDMQKYFSNDFSCSSIKKNMMVPATNYTFSNVDVANTSWEKNNFDCFYRNIIVESQYFDKNPWSGSEYYVVQSIGNQLTCMDVVNPCGVRPAIWVDTSVLGEKNTGSGSMEYKTNIDKTGTEWEVVSIDEQLNKDDGTKTIDFVAVSGNTNGSSDLTNKIRNAKALNEYPIDTKVDQMDTVIFGNYPQTDVNGNTKEPIEWIVLEKQNDKALLLSKYILDYDVAGWNEKTDWETSGIRSWLNSNFISLSFAKVESDKIISTNLKNENNPVYGTSCGNDTVDKVFILSVEECKKYFGIKQIGTLKELSGAPNKSNGYRINSGIATNWTPYALNKFTAPTGEKMSSLNNFSLRTLGKYGKGEKYCSFVDCSEEIINLSGNYTNGIRPAIWVSLANNGTDTYSYTGGTVKTVLNGWQGDYYYLNGTMLKNAWAQYGNDLYYCGPTGAILKSQWIDNTFYVDSTGKMLKNTTTPDGYKVGADGKYIADTSLFNLQETKNANIESSNVNETIDNNDYSKPPIYDSSQIIISNSDIKSANASTVKDSTGNKLYVIDLIFTNDGKKKFEEATTRNIGLPLFIIYNNEIISAPYIMTTISDGKAQISEFPDLDSAKKTAKGIKDNSGTLHFVEGKLSWPQLNNVDDTESSNNKNVEKKNNDYIDAKFSFIINPNNIISTRYSKYRKGFLGLVGEYVYIVYVGVKNYPSNTQQVSNYYWGHDKTDSNIVDNIGYSIRSVSYGSSMIEVGARSEEDAKKIKEYLDGKSGDYELYFYDYIIDNQGKYKADKNTARFTQTIDSKNVQFATPHKFKDVNIDTEDSSPTGIFDVSNYRLKIGGDIYYVQIHMRTRLNKEDDIVNYYYRYENLEPNIIDSKGHKILKVMPGNGYDIDVYTETYDEALALSTLLNSDNQTYTLYFYDNVIENTGNNKVDNTKLEFTYNLKGAHIKTASPHKYKDYKLEFNTNVNELIDGNYLTFNEYGDLYWVALQLSKYYEDNKNKITDYYHKYKRNQYNIVDSQGHKIVMVMPSNAGSFDIYTETLEEAKAIASYLNSKDADYILYFMSPK